ncbi:MAG: glycosyltransferase [Thermodesulfovibrionales bacterium]|nr:glycosyltransferase [Thermodesulfovibrionales bacterium]
MAAPKVQRKIKNSTNGQQAKKNIVFLIYDKNVSLRYRLLISTFRERAITPTIVIWEQSPSARKSSAKINIAGARIIHLKGQGDMDTWFGKLKAVREYLKTLGHAMRNIRDEVDTIYATHIVHLIFLLRFKKKNRKVIYDAAENSMLLLPVKFGPLGDVARMLAEKIETLLVKLTKARAITVSGPRASRLPSFSKAAKNAEVIWTVPAISQSATDEDIAIAKKRLSGKKVVACVGGLEQEASLRVALEVAESMVASDERYFFMFIGKTWGNQSILKKLICDHRLEGEVVFLQNMPYRKMMSYLENSHVGLALHSKECDTSLSSVDGSLRMFSFMQAGLPIVGADFSEASTLAKATGCGLFVDTTNPVEVSTAVAYLLNHPAEAKEKGAKGKNLFMNKYNWDLESRKFLKLLHTAMN